MSDKLTDKLVGAGEKPELSPNPYGSGYTKQLEVDALSSIVNPEVNVLYICQGRKYKYAHAIIDPATDKILVPAGFVRVENGPEVHNVDGGRGTPVHENVAPQVPPRVFNEPVALNGGVTIKGKQIEDYVDTHGGVTHEELDEAIQGVEQQIADLPDPSASSFDSGDATEGQVLTADGEGGATFAAPPTGKNLYLHIVKVGDYLFHIFNNSNIAFTSNTFKEWLVAKGFTSGNCLSTMPNQNFALKYADNTLQLLVGVWCDGNSIRTTTIKIDFSTTVIGKIDTVSQGNATTSFTSDVVIEM